MSRSNKFHSILALIAAFVAAPTISHAQTTAAPMVMALGDRQAIPIFTVGETITGWTPPGVLDGMGTRRVGNIMEIYVNHEITGASGTVYHLANGTALKGARITRFEFDVDAGRITGAGSAFERIYDRKGQPVVHAHQIKEGVDPLHGVDKLCSAALFKAGTFNLVDDIYFTGEEIYNGQAFALDLARRNLWSLPWLGRATFENVTLVRPQDPGRVAVLIGDDSPGAPLYLYLGVKDHHGDGGFLDRNGLAHGVLHVLVADDGSLSPQQFNGTGSEMQGKFVPIAHYDAARAGTPGYDVLGFADQLTQYGLGAAAGMFRFSRPEDLATDPTNDTRVVLASTGRGSINPADDWGTTYIFEVDLEDLSVQVRILYDGDDAGAGRFEHPDHGLRNPDNLAWAGDGHIYIQEDRSTMLNVFGGTSGMEASIWKLHPTSGMIERVAMVDRQVALPHGQYDVAHATLGAWETSGIIDISEDAGAPAGEIWLLFNVQAHGVQGGAIAADTLMDGGQLLILKGGRAEIPGGILAGTPEPVPAMDLYPVPVSNILHVRFSEPVDGHVEMVVMDLQGRRMRSVKNAGTGRADTRTINVAHLTPGVYILQVTTGNKVRSIRFIKE